jgi:galactokinase
MSIGPDRSSLKKRDCNIVQQHYNTFKSKEQLKDDYEKAMTKLTEEYQQSKERLRKDYEARLFEIDSLQTKTVVNMERYMPKPNK